MLISISYAEKHLDDLVAKAEAGDEVVLTRQGRAVARLVVVKSEPFDPAARRRVLEEARTEGRAGATTGERAARSQDFLYADDGTLA